MQWTDDVGFVDLRIMEDGKTENGSDPKMVLMEAGASPAIFRDKYESTIDSFSRRYPVAPFNRGDSRETLCLQHSLDSKR